MSTAPGLPAALRPEQPLTALAPMQDVTDLAFMRVMARYGAPDYFFTEFFRVHAHSHLERHILQSIDENSTGRPVFAQLIGEDVPLLVRAAVELQNHPIAGIDLNLGCPAPKVYKKNVGGGLLRDLKRVDEILRALRDVTSTCFTVKTRIGFDSPAPFEPLLDLINTHHVDLLSVHGRTVKEMYRSDVHYDYIARAVERVRCPVLANGNIVSAARAADVARQTRARGVMVGRHAIRNPWIFRQCRERFARDDAADVFHPTLADVRDYVEHLYIETETPGVPERLHVNKMKKYLNFVGQGVDPSGAFLYAMRRTETRQQLFDVCDQHLLGEPTRRFAEEPYPGVIARPNCETPAGEADGCSLETITA